MEIVAPLAAGLSGVDLAAAAQLVEAGGPVQAARKLSCNASSFGNMLLAGRLLMRDLRDRVSTRIPDYVDRAKARLAPGVAAFLLANAAELQAELDEASPRDFQYDWFSASTLRSLYLLRETFDGEPCETPQLMYLRIAVQFYGGVNDVATVRRTFRELSARLYTPASPTIFNAGTTAPQLSSCFLLTIDDDLRHILKVGIFHGGMISKGSGGLGFDISRIRHSEIANAGYSRGVIAMLRLYDALTEYVDQGGRRKGAATVYLPPHHIDVFEFIQCVDPQGDHHERFHDLNIALWVPRLFWRRAREDGPWTLFDPKHAPELNEASGREYVRRYLAAEQRDISPKYRRTVRARDLLTAMCTMQRRAGMPYILHACACNKKSNQQHLGYIRQSNLCCEIVEKTDNDSIASCNLASVSLRAFAAGQAHADASHAELRAAYDFAALGAATRSAVENLNRVIDVNHYPLDKYDAAGEVRKRGNISRPNFAHRPIGLGVSGLAEALHITDLAFEDPATARLNEMIFACMYFNALCESVRLARRDGAHESFPGSPFSEGRLQFDLWREEFEELGPNPLRKAEDDDPLDPAAWGQGPADLGGGLFVEPTWDALKAAIRAHGTRNSLLLALMPTASTAQILENCESVEAHMSNYYTRFVLKGDFIVVNRYLLADLEALGAWNTHAREFLLVRKGSVQGFGKYVAAFPGKFPEFTGEWERLARIERKYKTMWEIPQMVFLRLAAKRGRYIDQSQSTNVYIKDCTDDQLRALHLNMDYLGLKTLYYLRSNPVKTSHGVVAAAVERDILSVFAPTKPAPVVPAVAPAVADTPAPAQAQPANAQCDGEVCHFCCS